MSDIDFLESGDFDLLPAGAYIFSSAPLDCPQPESVGLHGEAVRSLSDNVTSGPSTQA